MSISNHSALPADQKLEYALPKSLQNLVSPNLYHNYSIAMSENQYETALRLARQIDMEISEYYYQSTFSFFYAKHNQFTYSTGMYVAQQRLINHDYIGAWKLYQECSWHALKAHDYTVYSQAGDAKNEIAFILNQQLKGHFKLLESMSLEQTDIDRLEHTLEKITEIFSLQLPPITPASKKDMDRYNFWNDKLIELRAKQNFNIDNVTTSPGLTFSKAVATIEQNAKVESIASAALRPN
jgi:hypothetical protein